MTNKQTEINQLLTANGGSWFFCVCSEGVVRFGQYFATPSELTDIQSIYEM